MPFLGKLDSQQTAASAASSNQAYLFCQHCFRPENRLSV
jgi:hypothetical protein